MGGVPTVLTHFCEQRPGDLARPGVQP